MSQSVQPGESRFPGNKRQRRSRAAKLRWTSAPERELRLAGVEGPAPLPSQEVASPMERAAVLARLPVWLLVGGLQSDEPFSGFAFPSRIVHKLNGRTILDVAVKTCWCTNPYVIFPIPENVISR